MSQVCTNRAAFGPSSRSVASAAGVSHSAPPALRQIAQPQLLQLLAGLQYEASRGYSDAQARRQPDCFMLAFTWLPACLSEGGLLLPLVAVKQPLPGCAGHQRRALFRLHSAAPGRAAGRCAAGHVAAPGDRRGSAAVCFLV